MQLTDFCNNHLKILAQQPLTEQPSVILFSSKNYSPLAFAHILQWLQQPTSSVIPDSDLGSRPL